MVVGKFRGGGGACKNYCNPLIDEFHQIFLWVDHLAVLWPIIIKNKNVYLMQLYMHNMYCIYMHTFQLFLMRLPFTIHHCGY